MITFCRKIPEEGFLFRQHTTYTSDGWGAVIHERTKQDTITPAKQQEQARDWSRSRGLDDSDPEDGLSLTHHTDNKQP